MRLGRLHSFSHQTSVTVTAWVHCNITTICLLSGFEINADKWPFRSRVFPHAVHAAISLLVSLAGQIESGKRGVAWIDRAQHSTPFQVPTRHIKGHRS
jgi:hypothetical protein